MKELPSARFDCQCEVGARRDSSVWDDTEIQDLALSFSPMPAANVSLPFRFRELSSFLLVSILQTILQTAILKRIFGDRAIRHSQDFLFPPTPWITLHAMGTSSPAAASAMNGWTDEQLVARWQDGDRQAFELLVRRYQHVAFTVCHRYLRNPQIAEETAQDVFLSLYRKLGDFRNESSFKSWFYRVLTNHCHNRHKAGTRRREQQHDSIDTPADPDDERGRIKELKDPNPTSDQVLEEAQRQALIERALQAVGEEARMILLLREGQGMAYEDIGAALNLNAGTVKSRLFRARAELKAAVDRLRGDEL